MSEAAISAVTELAKEAPLSPEVAAAYALGFKAGAAATPEDDDMGCGGSAEVAEDPRSMFHWPPLESDPEIFADFATKLGLVGYTTGEVFSFDPEMLGFLPFSGPACAAIACVRRMPASKANDYDRGDLSTEVDYYMDQTGKLDNACGVIALVHSILNTGMTLKEGSPLALFQEANKSSSPAERARSLESFTAIHDLYKETAQAGNESNANGVHEHVETAADGSISVVEKTFHFIAYVRNAKNQLVELDGTKKGPWVIAEGVAEADFMVAVGKEFNRRLAEKEIDPSASVMALGPKA